MRNMKKMMWMLVIVAISIGVFSVAVGQPLVSPEKVGLSSQKLANIDKVVEQAIANKEIPGAVVLVARKGQIAYLKAIGNADDNRPYKTDDIFRIASMSKTITAVAVMQLFERGKILLTDPISKYIPEFKNPKVASLDADGNIRYSPAKREITIHDLLSMSSGISSRAGGNEFLNKLAQVYKEIGLEDEMGPLDMTLEQYAKIVAKCPLANHPGTVMDYSNAGANTLGYLVEVVSGMRFDQYLDENIFKPLNMTDTMFFPAGPQLKRVVPPYYSGTLKKVTGLLDWGLRQVDYTYTTDKNRKFCNPSGGLHGTVYDYFRFGQMLVNYGQLDGVRVLGKESVKIMTSPVIVEPFFGNMWGYMFDIQAEVNGYSNPSFLNQGGKGAFGWLGFWGTKGTMNPDKETVVVIYSQIFPFMAALPYQQKITQVVNGAIID